MALLAATASFEHVIGGLTNAGMCKLMTGLYDPDYNPCRATYDLRRLRRKGFIERIQGTHTYRITAYGPTTAIFLTKLNARAVVPALTDLEAPSTPLPPQPRPLTNHRVARLQQATRRPHRQLRTSSLKLTYL